MRRTLFILLALLLLSLPLAAQDDVLEWSDCPFPLPAGEREGDTIDCFYLTVPQNRADPESQPIWLAAAILYSASPDPLPDPILYLEGGPGGSALSGIDGWTQSPLRAERDIILFDQRGTGYSQPFLGCLVEGSDTMDEMELWRVCRDQFTLDGVDLSAYNSAASAADIQDLRAALGVESWNLIGISYGTRLALTALRDSPEGIRSVVLDSVYPPQVQAYEEQGPNMVASIQHLFAACAADAACDDAYPDLENRFYTVYEELNNDPLLSDETDDNGDTYQVTFTGDDLFDQLVQALYDTTIIPYLPLALTLAWEGDFDTARDLLQGGGAAADDPLSAFTASELAALRQSFNDEQIASIARMIAADTSDDDYAALAAAFSDDERALIDDILAIANDDTAEVVDVSDSDGMNTSVECYEEIAFSAIDRAYALVDSLPAALQERLRRDIEIAYGVCDFWGAGVGNPIENEPVSSPLPVLLVAGAFDPVTPPAWAEAAAAALPNRDYVLFPSAGHGIMDINACAVSIYAQFLANPDQSPDMTCAADLTVVWALR